MINSTKPQEIIAYLIGIGFIISGFYRIYYLGFDGDITQLSGLLKTFLYLFAYLQIGLGLMMLYKKMQHLAGWGMLTLLVIISPFIIADYGIAKSCLFLKSVPASISWLTIVLHFIFMIVVYKVVWGRNY